MISEIHPPAGSAETIPSSPLVSVVVVTLGRIDCLQKLLASVRRQNYPRLEIIVVDNAAMPPVALADSTIKLIRNSSNVGACAGRNQGSSAAGGEWLLFFDDDAELIDEKFIARALDFAVNHPNIGAIGFPQIAPDGAWMSDQPAHRDYPCTTDKFYGYACLVRKQAHEAIGGYNPLFLYCFEENDFCLKLHCAGYAIVYLPHLRVIHHQHLFGRNWHRTRWLCARNAMICTLQIYPLYSIPFSLVQILRSFIRNARHHGDSPWWDAGRMAFDLIKLARSILAGRKPTSIKSLLTYKRLREERRFSDEPTLPAAGHTRQCITRLAPAARRPTSAATGRVSLP